MLKIFIVFLFFPFIAHAYDKEYVVSYLMQDKRLNRGYVQKFIDRVKIDESVIAASRKPAEKKYWFEYKKIFINKKHIVLGRKFIKRHKKLFDKIERRFRINRYILTAILGMETFYGNYEPKYSVANSLYTFSLFSERDRYFLSELKSFLVYAKINGRDPFNIKGSYAGAIGIPQFMPSNIMTYGVDFDKDGRVDIENSLCDALASEANFLSAHGWIEHQPTAIKLKGNCRVKEGTVNLSDIQNCLTERVNKLNTKIRVVYFKEDKGYGRWACFNNCSVLLKYNRSPNYALSAAILASLFR